MPAITTWPDAFAPRHTGAGEHARDADLRIAAAAVAFRVGRTPPEPDRFAAHLRADLLLLAAFAAAKRSGERS